MEVYLLRRFDRPLAWLAAFGIPAVFAGAVAGLSGELPGGVLGGAAIIGGLVGSLGLTLGCIAWLCCRWIGGLDQPARRPERWARPVRCYRCDWKLNPDGPVTRRDCLCPPPTCPRCASMVIAQLPDCPSCHSPLMTGESIARDMRRLARWPRTFGQAFKGDFVCRACRTEYDRWGRAV